MTQCVGIPTVKTALSMEPRYLGNLQREANLDTWSSRSAQSPFLLGFQGSPSPGFSLHAQPGPLYGKISATTQPEAGDLRGPNIPVQKNMASTFLRTDAVSVVVLGIP